MTVDEHFLPARRSVAVLLPPGSQLVGCLGFLEALDAANRIAVHYGGTPLYDVRVVGVEADTSSAAGVVIATEPPTGAVHTLVVGGSLDLLDRPVDPRVLAACARLAAEAERVVSVCMGAFVLGALGSLDGKRCTTHWLGLDALRERFPAAHVQDDAIYTSDGSLFTSAGATAGIDLALHLIGRDGDRRLALGVARTLVVFAHRPGGQSQFGSAVRPRHDLDARLQKVVNGVVERPGGDHRVDVLARRAGMSARNFARVFRSSVGEPPASFVARVRVQAAQRALQLGDASIDQIGAQVGFGTTTTFRRTFRRVAGVSPSAWRRRFAPPSAS